MPRRQLMGRSVLDSEPDRLVLLRELADHLVLSPYIPDARYGCHGAPRAPGLELYVCVLNQYVGGLVDPLVGGWHECHLGTSVVGTRLRSTLVPRRPTAAVVQRHRKPRRILGIQ